MLVRRFACILVLVASCGDAPGDLDRGVVHDLSRTRGQARGIERTGRYALRLRAESCDCESLSGLWPSICVPLQLVPGEMIADVDVVETDGLLLVRLPGVGTLTGPIDADHHYSVGGVVDLGSPVGHGAVVLRSDGWFFDAGFTPPGESYTNWRVEGTLRRRAYGEFGDESTDCTEQVSFEAAAPEPDAD